MTKIELSKAHVHALNAAKSANKVVNIYSHPFARQGCIALWEMVALLAYKLDDEQGAGEARTCAEELRDIERVGYT